MEQRLSQAVRSPREDATAAEPTPAHQAVPHLTPSRRGSWFQAPHVCIPAMSGDGPLLVLIEQDAWQRALAECRGDVREAKLATFRRAERRGSWVSDAGERAIVLR